MLFRKTGLIVAASLVGICLATSSAAQGTLQDKTYEAGTTLVLKSKIVVDSNVVTMGDLFMDAGNVAHLPVAQAPAPGGRIVLQPSHIAAVAATQGLNWNNAALLRRVVVTRASRTVPHTAIQTALTEALIDEGAPERIELQLTDRHVKLHVATDGDPTVAVERVSYDAQSGMFEAYMRAPAGDEDIQATRVTGRAYGTVAVPVLRQAMNRGEVVQASDIDWVDIRTGRVAANMMTSAEDIIGMAVKRKVQAGQSLRVTDVERPVVVKKNAIVTIMYRAPGMVLTTEGRALTDGGDGDAIRVVNTQTNRTIEAQIVGPGRVTVSRAAMQIAAY